MSKYTPEMISALTASAPITFEIGSNTEKADIVRDIESHLNLDRDSLSGLDNATMASLNTLLEAVSCLIII
jgi:hypothetical protein